MNSTEENGFAARSAQHPYAMDEQSHARIAELEAINRRLQRSDDRLNATLRLSKQKALLDEDALLRMGLEEAVRLTDSDIGYLHFVNADQDTIQLCLWSENTLKYCSAIHDTHYPVSKAGIWADSVRLRAAVRHNNYPAIQNRKGYPDGHAPLQRHLGVPVIDDDKVVLLLGVGNKTSDYDDDDIDQLLLIGNDLWALVKQRRTTAELENQKRELERLVQERTADLLRAQQVAHIGSWKLDLRTQALTWSPETYRLFGVPEGTPLTLDDFLTLIHPEDRARVAAEWSAALDGKPYDIEHRLVSSAVATWVRERAELEFDTEGRALHAWGTVQDISAEKAHKAEVEFLTRYDALTGLPNQSRFLEQLRVCMAACITLQTRLVVAFMNIDGFSAVNDQLGRELGDRVLVEFARRLAESVRDRQHLARIGGDEFAVILTGLCEPHSHETPVRRMLRAISAPLQICGHSLQLTGSIGLTSYPHAAPAKEAEQLLRQASQAMYMAKLAGKNRFHMFDPVKDESTRERFVRLEEIRRAIEAGEMCLHYQPKIWLASGDIAGFEALVRWQHPERGLQMPATFVPVLDKHPLAIVLGDWVIQSALAQLAAWNAQGLRTCISVNVDAQQLADPDFLPRLARQLAAQPSVSPTQLELEILETGALENIAEEAKLIDQLQRMGVHCSLDDFGTGYSSLTFLKRLQVEVVKIDQSFVRGLLDDSENARIIHSVIGLSRSFDRHTLAEGVETLVHGRMLIELGCEMAQGYAIARPMPAEEVVLWQASWQRPAEWRDVTVLEQSNIPILLAEVEHRQWLRDLQDTLADNEASMPAMDEHRCRFGQWLNRRSTVRRLGHLEAYKAVVRTHSEFHRLAHDALSELRSPLSGKTAWSRLNDTSETLQLQLRRLRVED